MKRSSNEPKKHNEKSQATGENRPSTSAEPDFLDDAQSSSGVELALNPLDIRMRCTFLTCLATMPVRELRNHFQTAHQGEILMCYYCNTDISNQFYYDHVESCRLYQEKMVRILEWREECENLPPPTTPPNNEPSEIVEVQNAAAGVPPCPGFMMGHPVAIGNLEGGVGVVGEPIANPPVTGWQAGSTICRSSYGNYHEALICPVENCGMVMRKDSLSKHIDAYHLDKSLTIKCKHCKSEIPNQQFIETFPNYHLNMCIEYKAYRNLTLHFLRGGYIELK